MSTNQMQALIQQVIEKLSLINDDGDKGEGETGQRLRSEGSKAKVGNGGSEGSSVNQLRSVVVLLVEMVKTMVEQQEQVGHSTGPEVVQLKQEVEQLKVVQRQEKDELDETRQRNLKGNLIISSPNIGNKKSLIKSDAELKTAGLTLHGHILDLVKEKFGVTIPKGDIQTCHRLKNENNIILRVWNRAPDAAWWNLVTAIRTGVNPGTNLFANFQLTDRRNQLCYHLRKLKREKKISKMSTTENGQLSFRVKDNGEKIKVTYSSAKLGVEHPKTLDILDIDNIISNYK